MRARLALATTCSLMCLVVAVPAAQAAGGDSPQVVRVMRSLDRLTAIRAATSARLDAARTRLAGLRAEAAIARGQLQVDRTNLAQTRAMLARVLVGEYKSASPDPSVFVFDANSFGDLIDRIDALNRIGIAETDGVGQIVRDSAQVSADLTAVRSREQQVAEQVAALAAARAGLDRAIAERGALLRSLTRSERTAVATEARRRTTLAQRDGGGSQGSPTSSFTGGVTWYGPGFAGHRTASGEIFNPNALTAASPWLPFQTMLRVTSAVTGRSVEVRVNDRGPYGAGVLDLSAHAAQVIGLAGSQICRITILSEP